MFCQQVAASPSGGRPAHKTKPPGIHQICIICRWCFGSDQKCSEFYLQWNDHGVGVCVSSPQWKVITDFPGNATFFSFLEVYYCSRKICGLGNLSCFPPAALQAWHRNILHANTQARRVFLIYFHKKKKLKHICLDKCKTGWTAKTAM